MFIEPLDQRSSKVGEAALVRTGGGVLPSEFLSFELGPVNERRLGDASIVGSSDGGLIIERPWFSVRPLFVRIQDGAVLLSSQWEALAARGTSALDVGYVKDYLRFQTPHTRRTFSQAIRLVRHGERLRVTREGGMHTEPLPRPMPTLRIQDVPERLHMLLGEADHSCFHLSSGLDSSLLALLARRTHQRVTGVTLRTRGRGMADELPLVERLASEAGIALTIFDFTTLDIWREGENLMACGLGYPIAHPSHLARYLLDRAIAESGIGRRIVSGRGPDEVLAGYEAHRPEFADPARHIARLTCTSEEWVDALIPGDEQGDTRAHHAAFASEGTMSLSRRLEYDLGGIFECWNIVESDLARSLGVEYLDPFLDATLLTTFFALPDEQKMAGGVQKIALRTLFADIYPHYLLANPKVGLRLDLREYIWDESAQGIMARVWDASEFAERYLNRAAFLRLADDTLTSRANYGWQIWSLYLCALAYRKLSMAAIS